MIVNNIEQIKKLIAGCSKNEFYMLQIIHRSKDGENPFSNSNKSSQQIIKSYFVSSPEYLDYKMPEIIALCEMFNARAYINLNKKSYRQVCLKALELLARCIASDVEDDYRSIKSLFESACGQTGACDKKKTWIVDVDTKDENEVIAVTDAINKCEPIDTEKIQSIIPTLHGFHIISKPFNKMKFKELYNNQIDIHDNNPTLLYLKSNEN